MIDHTERLANRPLIGVSSGLVLSVVPLLSRVPAWAVAVLAGAVFTRFAANHLGMRLPGAAFRILIMALGVAGIAFSYGTMTGIEPGLGILLILISLKFLETKSPRDLQVLTLLGWFLCLCGLFFSQELSTWLYIGSVCLLLGASLVWLHLGETSSLRKAARICFTILLQAVPLAIILFLLFPRIYGGFRFVMSNSAQSTTGMSNRVEPGSIADLAYNHERAFRVHFPDGRVPSIAQMYWRGGVLWRCEGLTWTRHPSLPGERLEGRLGGPAIRQDITIEPHGSHWMFALDRPGEVRKAPFNAYFEAGGYLRSDRPISSRKRYEVVSRPESREKEITRQQLRAGLQLPQSVSPQITELVASWRSANESDSALVQAALNWFRRENFTYTMSPGTYGANSLDEFLFRRRSGFCEHYAAAFATLMRVAGIPSRLVIGYHGGELNLPHVVVRQSDAHAWAEVWYKDEGWKRVDPTSLIAPERIFGGFESYLELRGSGESGFGGSRSPAWTGLREIFRDVRLAWDRVNFEWDLRVLNFDEENQHVFLTSLGLSKYTWPSLLTWVLIGVTAGLSLVALWLRRPTFQRIEPVQRSYGRFTRKLARHGVRREPWEGPLQFGERAAAEIPEAAGPIRRISEMYARFRYGRQPGSARELHVAVRDFPRLRNGPRSNGTHPPAAVDSELKSS